VASSFVLSQIARHCFPHRPRHLNWFECSSMAPPHSGQRQFTMADRTFSFDQIEFCSHISNPQSTRFRLLTISPLHSTSSIPIVLYGLLPASTSTPFRVSPAALLDHCLESCTSPRQPCFYCPAWHSEEMCGLANAQAVEATHLKGSAQRR
jgi:hypothetical protein